jgi:hypothetical protein
MPSSFNSFLQRAFDATGAGSQNELASILKINRSAITQARIKMLFQPNGCLSFTDDMA